MHTSWTSLRAGRAAVRHWLLLILLSAGLALRVMAQAAYRPALLYIDSDRYLRGPSPLDPLGYRVLLWPLQRAGGLAAVAAVQHLLGLAMAVALYAAVHRLGIWRWAAALAAAPVLLDAYQRADDYAGRPVRGADSGGSHAPAVA